MTESFPIEPQLFQLYGAVFEGLMKGLLVSVAMLFAATIILIILCCREAVRQGRQKHSELPAAARRVHAEVYARRFGTVKQPLESLGCRDKAVQEFGRGVLDQTHTMP